MVGRNTNIYFQEKTYNKFRQVVGAKVSRFVNEAVEEKLAQIQQQQREELWQKLIVERIKELAKDYRPVLIISNDERNEYGDSAVAVPTTTDDIKNILPVEVFINNTPETVKEELRNFSKLASEVEEGLQNIQKEIKGLNKTIEELNAIEGELKNITTGLAELNKTGEELKGTGENIKGSLDDLGELKGKIDELTKLEIPLIELEKSLIKGGEGLEKEIKEKIGGLIDKIDEIKQIACPYCFN
ncbi:7572_t:CDS:2 [Ambispora gerdemannii]|uniref:7572_t:CDS:1 n=1 Tax=Ambispora gerdemannii TaxID=144530 RepID=A0A9N9GDP7_9GLOM|nr:7572_t:CDS:2 [Ambispora gerdemannii]